MLKNKLKRENGCHIKNLSEVDYNKKNIKYRHLRTC